MSRDRLQVQLGRSIALVALIVQGLVVLALSLLTSRQLHHRTDVLLSHLAHAEVHDMLEHGSGFHVHDLALQLPGLFGDLSTRYALVFDPEGRVLDRTDNLHVLADRVDLPYTGAEDASLFIDHELGGISMRLAIMSAKLEQRPVCIAVGVAHEDLETVLWQFIWTALGLGLLAALTIALAGAYFVRRRVADLNRLSEACQQMELSTHLPSANLAPRVLAVPDQAAAEVQQLAGTLQDLMVRVHGMMEMQNIFVAEAAHELRTPLTSLRGDLELALRRERTASDYRDFISEALKDVDRLQRLALQLLEGAGGRERQLTLERLDLSALVGEVIGAVQKHQDAKPLDLQSDLPEGLWVQAEPTALRRVLQTLIDNWISHAGPSTLRFSLERRDEATVAILVADNGRGIDADLAHRLFAPFQRGSQKGFGLGLYIAAQLMQALGGELTLQERQEPGACFRLVLGR